MNEAAIHETEMSQPSGKRTREGAAQSCRNAIRDGCRSISEFPIDMQQRIDARYAELCAEHQPKSSLERTLITEMARAEIQKDVAHRLLFDSERISMAVEETWDEDERRHTNNLAARLARDPQRVAELLLQSKHGAHWALTMWRGLEASVRANHGLTEAQRQLVSDEARAHKRYVWAFESFKWVRMGMPAAALIHPLTGKPLQDAGSEKAAEPPPAGAEATPSPAARPSPTADAQRASGCDSDKPTVAPDDRPVPLPDNASDEDKEMLLLVSATLRSMLQGGLVKPPTLPSPPT